MKNYHSKGDFPDDTFTENDVLRCLEAASLQYKQGRRYILTQCPFHDDTHPSAQIYKDDWFVNCNAGCGRQHITKAFPELRGQVVSGAGASANQGFQRRRSEKPQVKYQEYELRNFWLELPLIPRDHQFKGLPLEVLDEMGWRWLEDKQSYFIPYFDKNKYYIPFSQMRHLQGDRRFTFLKEAQPIMYGLWNLDNPKLFIVEGTSDAAVMQHCDVPWLAVPSAASGELVGRLAGFCDKNGIELVFAGDNDEAGLKIAQALDDAGYGYRVKQPPKIYKDWGDFYEAQGQEAVREYCFPELFHEYVPETDVDRVLAVFPGAKVLNLVDSPEAESKEQSAGEPTVLF